MRGNVIGFDPDTNTGAISGHDGNRYDFVMIDWRGAGRPRHGDVVDFQPQGQRAADIYLIEPEYVPPSFGQFYFSPAGRISRSQFWLKGLLPIWGVWLVLYAILIGLIVAGSAAGSGIFGLIFGIYGLAVIWPSIAINVKRIHDRNKSGWLMLIPIVPAILLCFSLGAAIAGIVAAGASGSKAGAGILVGAGIFTWLLSLVQLGISIWFFIEFGCLRGTVGSNQYGPDPAR